MDYNGFYEDSMTESMLSNTFVRVNNNSSTSSISKVRNSYIKVNKMKGQDKLSISIDKKFVIYLNTELAHILADKINSALSQ